MEAMFAVADFVAADALLMQTVWDDVLGMPQSAGFAAVRDERVQLVGQRGGSTLFALVTTNAADWDPRDEAVYFWVDG